MYSKNIFKKRYIIYIGIFFITIYTILFSSYIYNKNYWKKFLLGKTEEILGFNINYEDVDIFLLPSPGIIIKSIDLNYNNERYSLKITSRESKVIFSWHKVLRGKWKIDSLSLEDGKFTLSIPDSGIAPTTNNDLFPLSSLQILEVQLIKIDTLINYNNQRESFFIELLRFNHISSLENKLEFNLNYGGGSTKGNFTLGINSIIFDSNDIYLDGKISFERFPIRLLSKYYSMFKKQDFYNSRVSGNIVFKKDDEFSIDSKINLTLFDLNFKDIQASQPLTLAGDTIYEINSKRFIFKNLSVRQQQRISALIDGELIARKNTYLNLVIHSDYCEIEKSLEYILSFIDTESTSNNKFSAELKIFVKNLHFRDYIFKDTESEITINESIIKLNLSKTILFDGLIKGDGIIKSEDINSYNFSIKIEKMNVEKCIQKFTEKKYLIGFLNSEFHLQSLGNTINDFETNLKIRGFVSVKSGGLKGYANFLKPLMELGKLVNILGPKGSSGEFQSLESNFFLEKRVVEIPDLKMKGVGIDASGSGKLDFESNIDFRILVSLGGIAGKAFAIPILYKGIFEKNFAFIDPFWLGSVYFGITIGGPVTGGIAGSIATEYIHSTYEKIKQIFNF